MKEKLKAFLRLAPTVVLQFLQSLALRIRTLFRKKRRIVLIGTPEYGNLGDHLIALGELQWLHDHFPDDTVREFTHETLLRDHRLRLLRAQLRRQDILFLQGGGNMNDKYMNCEMIRRAVIRHRPKNRIILFPQSLSYAQTPQAQQIKKETAALYDAHPALTILAREETSFRTAQEMFPHLRTLLVPDMAAYLFGTVAPSENVPRSGITLCLRTDAERYYSSRELTDLFQTLSETDEVRVSGTNLFHTIPIAQRPAYVQAFVDMFSKRKLVVTDRFHGIIFAVLARTPCIALRSSDHKIVDGLMWFRDLPGVFFAETPEDVPRLAKIACEMGAQPQADLGRYFTKLYDDLQLDPEGK